MSLDGGGMLRLCPLLRAVPHRASSHLVAELAHSHSQTTAADPVAAPVPDDDLPALAAALPHHRHLTHTATGCTHALLLSPLLALAAISRAPRLPAPQLLLFAACNASPAWMRDEMEGEENANRCFTFRFFEPG